MDITKGLMLGVFVVACAAAYVTLITQKELVDKCVKKTGQECVVTARPLKEVESKGY